MYLNVPIHRATMATSKKIVKIKIIIKTRDVGNIEGMRNGLKEGKRTGKNNERVNNNGKFTTLRSGVTLLPDFRVIYAAEV